MGKMKVNPLAQRDLNQARVDHLVSHFDPEQLGNPTVNERDGHFYIIDGQHRIEALKAWLEEGWETQTVQCWTYVGLDEEVEAETFLKLNDTLTVAAFPRYRAAITAGRAEECEIDAVVRLQGLVVSPDNIPGAVHAVGTLKRVFKRSDSITLGRALRIIRDAYGDEGFESIVIDGLGLLCHRYNGDLDEKEAIKRLANAHGGVGGLLNLAETTRRETGKPKGQCVAAAAVTIINRQKGKKLPSWWKS